MKADYKLYNVGHIGIQVTWACYGTMPVNLYPALLKVGGHYNISGSGENIGGKWLLLT